MFIMLLLCSNLSFCLYAQNPQKSPTIVNPNNAGSAQALTPEEFSTSVVMAQNFSGFAGKSTSFKAPITIEILNFHKTKKLLPFYTFDGIKYNDDGRYFDAVAGDGIFTSTMAVKVSSAKSLPDKRYIAAPNFKYKAAFDSYLNGSGVTQKTGISFSCKVRVVTCPENNWWDSCWPLQSPCSCVEFYDCEFTIDIGLF